MDRTPTHTCAKTHTQSSVPSCFVDTRVQTRKLVKVPEKMIITTQVTQSFHPKESWSSVGRPVGSSHGPGPKSDMVLLDPHRKMEAAERVSRLMEWTGNAQKWSEGKKVIG